MTTEKGWLDRKLDEAEAYRKEFSDWDDFKFTAAGLFLLLAPFLLVAAIGLALFLLFR